MTETVFSHPSKLDLIYRTRTLAYRVVLYHVHVRDPKFSVARVAARVKSGGHDVPENEIRQRYERNQSLIRDAAMLVDKAIVYDNSVVAAAFKLVLEISDRANSIAVAESAPAWVFELYLAH